MAQQWDDVLNKIAKTNADKWKIPTDQAKEIVDCYVSCNMKEMRKGNVVLWVNIGRFYRSSPRTLKWMLNFFGPRQEDTYKRVTETPKEIIREKLIKHWPELLKAEEQDPRDGAYYRYQRAVEAAKANGEDMAKFFRKKSFLIKQRLEGKSIDNGKISGGARDSRELQPIPGQPGEGERKEEGESL